MKQITEDREIQQYRDLMPVPDEFEEGFGIKTVVGALFLGLFMMPGSIYMRLVMGQTLGPAARWVTIILFAEVARRSFKDIRKQEIFILYYMTGMAIAAPFQGMLWNQYLVQSPAAKAMGIAADIPIWVAPPEETIKRIAEEVGHNTFFHKAWIGPIAIIFLTQFIRRVDHFGLGYVLYRITSDVEQLPFPMAPVAAAGTLALAESREERGGWRWRCFSIGGMMGAVFGFFYVGVPALTGAVLNRPMRMIPIPWVDFTTATEGIMPATAVNVTLNLGLVITGMVLPFWAVVGGFMGMIVPFVANPILYKAGYLTQWRPGMDAVMTLYSNHLDIYMSFGIGLTFAITLVSLFPIVRSLVRARRKLNASRRAGEPEQESALQRLIRGKPERGDLSIFTGIGIYLFSSLSYIGLCTWLIPMFPWYFFFFYAFVYTPIISYASAKVEGMAGQMVAIPMVREATYILSGYRGAKIWFAPVPIHNYGLATRQFRVVELTGTKLRSVIKTEMLVMPIVVTCSILFSEFLYRLGPVPSDAYPFAEKMWDLQAKLRCVTYTSTMEGRSIFFQALKFKVLGIGLLTGVSVFYILRFLNMPTMLVYGLVRGMGQTQPGAWVFEMIGALIGRFCLARRFGPDKWRKYAPVLLAGFSCGMGLVAMAAVSITLISKSIESISY